MAGTGQSITSAISAKQKLEGIMLVSIIAIAGFAYLSYRNNWFGLKDRIQAKLKAKYDVVPPAIPVVPGTTTTTPGTFTGTTDLSSIYTPPAGTGSVNLNSAMLSAPGIKPDPTIEANFQQELYKQMFLPYDQYPYLYDNNYRQALTTTPGSLDAANNPYNTVFGYRPPIQGGDIPPSDQNLDQYYQSIYQQFGLFPPGGGSTSYYDDQYFYPYTGFGNPPSLDPGFIPGTDIPTSGSNTTDQYLQQLFQYFQNNGYPGLTNAQFQALLQAIQDQQTSVTVTVPPIVETSHCDSHLCESRYHGKCNTECSGGNSSTCSSCRAACCESSGNMAFAGAASGVTHSDRKAAWKYGEDRAREIRLLNKASLVKIDQGRNAYAAKRSLLMSGISIA